MERTTWVEISRDAMAANLAAVSEHAKVPVCAVVKANGYGHGLIEAARIFAEAGAPMLGVTRIEEARSIRSAGITTPVLIMMPVLDVAEAVALDCDVTVGSDEQVLSLPQAARVHLKIDTGMGRLGIQPEEAYKVARAVRERASLEAVWTHFADAAGGSGRAQLERFRTIVTALRHDGVAVAAHAANSAALCALPEATFDMVRAGTLLYGQDPAGASSPFPLRQTFAWYARVVAVRTLPEGAPVGYGSEWRAKGPARIATIPIGYADGFRVEPAARTPTPVESIKGVARIAARALGRDQRVVFFGKQQAPVVGRVAMQAISVDVTGLHDVSEGSVAMIPGRRLLVNPEIERIVR